MSDFEIVSIDEIHHLVSPTIEAQLSPLGFEIQKPLNWVRSNDAPIRQMFSLAQYKGGAVAPIWGLSLDFVPHVSGSDVKWHRTVKSSRLDVMQGSRDRSMEFSYMYGPEQLSKKAPDAVSKALHEALAFWSTAKSVSDLPAVFESTKQYMSGGGLGFYNYVQHPLAYAFVLARLGRSEEAESELNHFLHPALKPSVVSRIRQLLSECAIT